jgi:hypothetical protein
VNGVERFIRLPKRVEGIAEIAPRIGVARVIANVDAEFVGRFVVASEGQQLEAKQRCEARADP